MRGPRVLRVAAGQVRGVQVTLHDRGFSAIRAADGWRLDGRPATDGAGEALDQLRELLADLRAIDAFATSDLAQFGLDDPAGTLAITTSRGQRRLLLGGMNASGSALYARRDGDRRVFQIGVGLLSTIERVFYQRELAARPAPS